ncbi:hypothetical protein CJP72_15410 [Citrobacter sp. NCU1]|uniref:hypothetical protein n=1 Tax=Citrobacter sp. NCU1 TaxID=2026683 RepID=UPI001390A0D4|nr:hypothetical protein [Citrobacter sp. NCU1]NDO82100.1 hypothetical protein [Citrobacter sp. NCU1]
MHTMLEKYNVHFDYEVIEDFRDEVNNNSDFAFKYFQNKDGKNLWNPICSCMDWISVAIRYINNYPELSSDLDVKAMQIFSLISSIDIINESVEQLHRILVNRDLKKWPFKGSKHIFEDKRHHLSGHDDDGYFKEIRAIFGAHPTKLQHGKERMFASWPHDHSFDGDDFTVSLYSNIPDKPDVSFGIRIVELLSYAKERYEYINELHDALIGLYDNYSLQLKGVKIPPTSSIEEELETLSSESEKRLDNDHYRSTISELQVLFATTVTEPHLQLEEQEFKDELLVMTAEIRANLQCMRIEDLEHDILYGSLPGFALSYELPKLFTLLHSDRYDPLTDYYFKQLNNYCDGKYTFSVRDGKSLTLLKLRMMLYTERKREREVNKYSAHSIGYIKKIVHR